LALDVFHDEVREAIFGRAPVQHPGDVGMVEARQDLPLPPEPRHDLGAVRPFPDELDGDVLLVLVVGSGG